MIFPKQFPSARSVGTFNVALGNAFINSSFFSGHDNRIGKFVPAPIGNPIQSDVSQDAAPLWRQGTGQCSMKMYEEKLFMFDVYSKLQAAEEQLAKGAAW
jgi:hypothetical protein